MFEKFLQQLLDVKGIKENVEYIKKHCK
jgi:hypothetical protein